MNEHLVGLSEIQILITRSDATWTIQPSEFDQFPFRDGDRLSIIPAELADRLPETWNDKHISVGPGHAIRVPPVYHFATFKDFQIPTHLVSLTGAGPETLDSIGRDHIAKYSRYVGLKPDMAIVDLGCGIGRDAFQLLDYLSDAGHYHGVDVTRDSIEWCKRNISANYPNFTFLHADAFNELYNPFGARATRDIRIAMPDGTVDRVVLASVFTHLLEDEVVHYMQEFRRLLKPDGLAYASFFLYTPEAISAAKTAGNTSWTASFECNLGDGVYGNDPTYPRGAVAYTDAAMRRMIEKASLRLVQPYLKGWWSGLYGDAAQDGQDAAILAPA